MPEAIRVELHVTLPDGRMTKEYEDVPADGDPKLITYAARALGERAENLVRSL